MNRKGSDLVFTWVFIVFFLFLIIFAVAVVFREKDNLQTQRPELNQDLRNQYTQATLIGFLRTQAPLSITGQTSIADLIVANTDGRYDAAIKDAVLQAMPNSSYFEITITYADRSMPVIGTLQEVSRELSVAQPESKEEYVAKASTLLPGAKGNIKISLSMLNRDDLEKIDRVVHYE
jgi:hypothetical protein